MIIENHEDILTNFPASQLEEKYGGISPNLTCFWPPKINDEWNVEPIEPATANTNYFVPSSLNSTFRQEVCNSFLSSNLDFEDVFWQECDMPEEEPSFVSEPKILVNKKRIDFGIQKCDIKSPSEELTQASSRSPRSGMLAPTMSIENDEIRPSLVCIDCMGKESLCNIM